MLSREFINETFNRVLTHPIGARVVLDSKKADYPDTVEACRIFIESGIDRVSGFELLFIPPAGLPDEWWAEKRRIPGVDYQPVGFRKYKLYTDKK